MGTKSLGRRDRGNPSVKEDFIRLVLKSLHYNIINNRHVLLFVASPEVGKESPVFFNNDLQEVTQMKPWLIVFHIKCT